MFKSGHNRSRYVMIEKSEILKATDGGLEVFNFYIPFGFKLKKNFRNPLYDDHNASCQIYFSKESHCYILHDFGNNEFHGDCFWYVSKLMGMNLRTDFQQILKTIARDLHLNVSSFSGRDGESSFSALNPAPKCPKPNNSEKKMKKYHVEKKVFSREELKYWGKYGITIDILEKYNVVSLSEYSSTNNEGKPYTLKSAPSHPMYGYRSSDFIKIYRPFEKMRFLYGGTLSQTYCFGIEQLPSRGDIVIITGGEKDVLSLASHGFYGICFNSETATIPVSIIEMLSRRFRHICLIYDTDETGMNSMEKAVSELKDYNLIAVRLPLSGIKTEKDVSDFFAKGNGREDLQKIIRENIEPLYSHTILLIKTCEMDFNNPPERSKMVVSAEGVPLGCYDNLLCITGGEGTGKSNFVSSIISGTLLTDDLAIPIDTLGMSVTPNYLRKAVLHFDTEQSEYQLYKNMNMTLRRSGLNEMPDFYHSFFLTTLSRKERIQLIRDSMDLYHNQHGGIHLVVIDGVADLVRSANDEIESIAVVEELYRLAGFYHTCIICVLHFIPNGIKLRGHIGSELQRKASSILSVEKDDNPQNSVVKTIKVREGNPLEVPMFLFRWDKNARMHVSAGKKSDEAKTKRKSEELGNIAKELFATKETATYRELVEGIISEMDVAERTAKDYISYMIKNHILIKESVNSYRLS